VGRRAEHAGLDAESESTATGAVLEVLMLRQALATLSPTDRAVLTLCDLEGFSMRDAARTLGLTHVATKLRASRARRKLARLLGARQGRTT
jgi:RNA polymerase sigma-70 factor (ECF subfamily)